MINESPDDIADRSLMSFPASPKTEENPFFSINPSEEKSVTSEGVSDASDSSHHQSHTIVGKCDLVLACGITESVSDQGKEGQLKRVCLGKKTKIYMHI